MFRKKWKQKCAELEFALDSEKAMVASLLQERGFLIARNAELTASNIRMESELKSLRKNRRTAFPPNPIPREPVSRRWDDRISSPPPQLRWGFFCSNPYKFHTHFLQFLLQAYLFRFLQFCHLLKHVHNLPLNYEVFLYYVL